MRTETFAPQALGLCVMAAALAGCQGNNTQAQAPSPLQFEVTDLGNPTHPGPVTAPSGSALDFPSVFDLKIRLVGVDPSTVQELRTYTTAYTPECNGRPIRDPYQTKVIVYPYGVTAAAPGPSSPGFQLPLSSRTLMELGQCLPRAPLFGDVYFQARILDANNVWWTSDLTLHINPPPIPQTQGG
jgi:hypothetical protein